MGKILKYAVIITIIKTTLKSSIPFWPSLNSELQINFRIRSLASSETSYIASIGKSKQFYEKELLIPIIKQQTKGVVLTKKKSIGILKFYLVIHNFSISLD